MPEAEPAPHHEEVIRRFVAACQADARVVAAFLGGSYAKGTADRYSDLDLYLITTDESYADFFAGRAAFMRQLGEPVFLENWDRYGFDLLLFVLADGTEGELGLGRESRFHHIHSGPYRLLLDKRGILRGAVFPLHEPSPAGQVETLRGLITWFWHDLAHFITAMQRGQLWSAYGALEDLRRACVNLARLRHNVSAAPEGYEKIEQAIPIETLSPLEAACCPLERGTMLAAARAVVRFYRELAPSLAQAHGVAYPERLEQLMLQRLDRVRA